MLVFFSLTDSINLITCLLQPCFIIPEIWRTITKSFLKIKFVESF